MSNIVVYNNGELELNVSVEQDTIWLTQKQIAELFQKDVKTVNEHIKSIYKDEELNENPTIRKYRIVQKEGNREVSREVNHYNLDMIISVGYRVNSKTATKFRQWATTVLKNYITNGYAINAEKITNERFVSLEKQVNLLSEDVNILKSKELKSQGIFFNGQIFDAYTFISDLLRTAKKKIILIDNYVDDTTLTFFSKIPNIKITIYTHTISKQLKLDLAKYNKQYNNITLKTFKDSHDRFLIIDDNELYHIGASFKDAGNKWFAFSKMDMLLVESIRKKLI
jgi:prophage antirepressor-like protein